MTAILGRRGSIPKGVSAAQPHAAGGPSRDRPSRSAAASRILAPEEKGTSSIARSLRSARRLCCLAHLVEPRAARLLGLEACEGRGDAGVLAPQQLGDDLVGRQRAQRLGQPGLGGEGLVLGGEHDEVLAGPVLPRRAPLPLGPLARVGDGGGDDEHAALRVGALVEAVEVVAAPAEPVGDGHREVGVARLGVAALGR
eukprot:scaffold58792_cov60-Phaeocystis_antarctica.AAC.2